MNTQEERIQYEIVEWFRNNYCLKFHNPRYCILSIPNDGKDLKEQMRKKSTGLMSGASDLILILQNRLIFVELKSETGVQSDKQKDFEVQVNNLGFEYKLIRSLNEFKEYIQCII